MTSIPEISARGSLILWAEFQIPVGPRSGREGEKCRPLDHKRHIPFVHLALFTSFSNTKFYIYSKLSHLFPPYGIFTMCRDTVCIYNLRMRFSRLMAIWSNLIFIRVIIKQNFSFLKKLWSCVGGRVKIWFYQTSWLRSNCHHERFGKLTFRVSASSEPE